MFSRDYRRRIIQRALLGYGTPLVLDGNVCDRISSAAGIRLAIPRLFHAAKLLPFATVERLEF
tara:strand:- start:433 stop:621 length:189 start_codon:yes stop_codon:yes gene_type:complete